MKECLNSVVQNNNNKTLWMSPSGFIKKLVFEFVSYLLGCFSSILVQRLLETRMKCSL